MVKPIDFLALRAPGDLDPPGACTFSSEDESEERNSCRLAFAWRRGADASFDAEPTGVGTGRPTEGLTVWEVLALAADKRSLGADGKR